ncbi:hypothetical protein UB31_35405 [Bradyrhizobium sp. LTSP849]|uniref:hypothetical protein n=1 Tax=Bradyrhizobium sp. LTSP849 TaxID=1615890 RepID=UPI0005D201AE|nr:hypothetical protein [Bradyrhizobium sp. LTSP849]KJC37506.1 hypothetical protein UB31_35405 [Bradyrhizobium sp. LTSP849]
MSAIVLQFPLAHTEESNVLDGCVDISPVDRRGFVILDACVPPIFGIQLMILLGNYERKSAPPCPNASVVRHDRDAFAFECTQVEPNGNYFIDACIPLAVAIDFEKMTRSMAILHNRSKKYGASLFIRFHAER